MRLPTKPSGPEITYTTIPSFGWDQDKYGVDPNYVYVYITSGVDGVGDIKDRVSCEFTKSSFDLRILDLSGKNLRLLKNYLDKEIIPAESKCITKKNRLTIKLKKVKGEYGYDQWIDLTAKKCEDARTGRAHTHDHGHARLPLVNALRVSYLASLLWRCE